MTRRLFLTLTLVLAATDVRACTYCNPDLQRRQTFTEDARQARFVVFGSLTNPRLNGEQGLTDFAVEKVVKDDPALGKRKTITLHRYVPVDPKNPPRFLLFCEVQNGRVDAYRGVPVKGAGAVEYVRGSLAIPEKERGKRLLYHFAHIDSADPDVAADAFHEFAKASDREVGEVGKHLKPEKLRQLLADPGTPADRLGVFAFLLGACGSKADADLLARMLAGNDERTSAALGGLLGGLIELRPEEGWKLATAMLRDRGRPFNQRLAVLGTLRFYHAWKPDATKRQVLDGLGVLIEDGDMADLGVEDLRRWQWWEMTDRVLAQYGKPTHAAPLVRRSIIRYALTCPEPAAAAFVKARRAEEAMTVQEVEESLEFEKPTPVSTQPAAKGGR